MNKIILASASPRRKELLKQIGMEYEVIPSEKEEKTTKSLPCEIVQELSYQKADEICSLLTKRGEKGFTIIGADTVVSFMDTVMGKPKSREEACEMLGRLQGNVHQVYTGVTICVKEKDEPAVFHTFYEKTDVSMYAMNSEEISSYVESGEPMDKAGSYAIQGGCAAYIQSICGDYNNVVGLPIGRLYQEMKTRNLL
jgi:septum formation protein